MSEGPQRTLPPDDAVCGAHPQRPALASCPRCGAYACLSCWHHAVALCQDCLLADPSSAAPPVPWEDPSRGAVSRFFGTFASALRPTRSSPAFARHHVGRAAWFALLVAVPLAALRGVIPFTHTLAFGSTFEVSLVGTPTTGEIALDVLRAMGISLGIAAALFASLAVPYASLCRAYGPSPYERAGLRMMLYRAWLLTVSMYGVVFWLVVWAAPEGSADVAAQVAAIAELLPLLLLFISMRSTARIAHGVGPFASLLVVLVPLVLMILTQSILAPLVSPWLPDTPGADAALGMEAP